MQQTLADKPLLMRLAYAIALPVLLITFLPLVLLLVIAMIVWAPIVCIFMPRKIVIKDKYNISYH